MKKSQASYSTGFRTKVGHAPAAERQNEIREARNTTKVWSHLVIRS